MHCGEAHGSDGMILVPLAPSGPDRVIDAIHGPGEARLLPPGPWISQGSAPVDCAPRSASIDFARELLLRVTPRHFEESYPSTHGSRRPQPANSTVLFGPLQHTAAPIGLTSRQKPLATTANRAKVRPLRWPHHLPFTLPLGSANYPFPTGNSSIRQSTPNQPHIAVHVNTVIH